MLYYMSCFPISLNVIFSAFVSSDMLYMYTHICILCRVDSTSTSACLVFADEIASYTQGGAGPDGKSQLKRMVSEEAKLKRMSSVSESEKKEEKKV